MGRQFWSRVEDGIAELVIENPPVNALDSVGWRAFAAAVDALQADAERKHTEIMATINQQRGVLEGRIDQLRTFEKQYRSRLTAYLESQLSELGKSGSAEPADAPQAGRIPGLDSKSGGSQSSSFSSGSTGTAGSSSGSSRAPMARTALSKSAIWAGKASRKKPEMRRVTSTRGRPSLASGMIS